MSDERVIIVSHAHPDLSKGGAELAAYLLHASLRSQGVESLFLARASPHPQRDSPFSWHRSRPAANGADELLFHTSMSDTFLLRSDDVRHIRRDFRELLQRYAPTVVHFQHYVNIGLEAIREARRSCPRATLVLTLHEYILICHRFGQMCKVGTEELCHAASPAACARCFPERTPADFFLREKYVKKLLEMVDLFVAPSEFLAGRFREWGLRSDRLVVLDYGHPETVAPEPRRLAPGERRGRLAFFGQITPFKGLEVLLEAVALVPDGRVRGLHLDIHGSNLDQYPLEFRERIGRLIERAGSLVSFRGAYRTEELWPLMAATDWVVVPSIWWENSPMVIQEAFRHGRPVICSNVGGMAEKVTHGVDGLHFHVRSARSLCDVISEQLDHPERWDELHRQIKPPPTTGEVATAHRRLYQQFRPRPA